MRLIIAILLGTLASQCAPFKLGLGRYDASSHKNVKRPLHPALEKRFRNSRQGRARRSVKSLHTNVRECQIYSRNHFYLQVSKDGRVNGTLDRSSKNTWFKMLIYGGGKTRLFNTAHKRYVAINRRGVVISQKNKTEESLFYYYPDVDHDRFSSTKYRSQNGNNINNWFLTIKKNGKVKNAKRTKPKMKAVQFLLIEPK